MNPTLQLPEGPGSQHIKKKEDSLHKHTALGSIPGSDRFAKYRYRFVPHKCIFSGHWIQFEKDIFKSEASLHTGSEALLNDILSEDNENGDYDPGTKEDGNCICGLENAGFSKGFSSRDLEPQNEGHAFVNSSIEEVLSRPRQWRAVDYTIDPDGETSKEEERLYVEDEVRSRKVGFKIAKQGISQQPHYSKASSENSGAIAINENKTEINQLQDSTNETASLSRQAFDKLKERYELNATSRRQRDKKRTTLKQ
ncbi:predicted protein [Arabidopsis lyrata subsp. lyrata]|uniref:Predicted protein n=1 Tax=Arabidopsis lyrata subsp. lyrata TaxID=81972 RepID=D7L7K2_ARALL|nr:predicted protein [Arabidopsis lyrata subsp. lyrata]